MAVKYVKDFIFGPMTSVQRYAKGGHVTKVPAKAKDSAKGMPARAKPNAPAKGAKRMESPPKMGKGQGYKDGGKVPGKKMDRLPTKTPPGRDKDLAPAKPFKGPNQGYNKGGKARRYAEGGDVQDPRFASIEPGAGSPLDAGTEVPQRMRYTGPVDITGERLEPSRPISLNQYGEADPYGGRPVRDITLEPYRPIPVDEVRQSGLNQYGEMDPFGGRPVRYEGPTAQTGSYSPAGTDSGAYYALTSGRTPVAPTYVPLPTRPYDAGVVEPLEPSPYRPADELMRGMIGASSADLQQTPPKMDFLDAAVRRDRERMRNDAAQQMRDLDEMQRRGGLYGPESRPAPTLASSYEPPMARAVRNVGAGRDVGLSDLMAAARAQGMMQRPGMFSPQAMYAKGGQVKGQAKIGKVMGEYKRGELHSGSKKGPLVKNPKQAVAIALSEARKSGAKIAKKAEGGLSDKELGGKSFAGRNEPLRGRYVSREEKIMREAVAKEKQKDMERKMREAYERTQSQSVSGLKKGGMARKGVPTHKAKAMYGGGKC